MSILIVEDEPDIRALITDFLEEEGYQVTSVTNGLAALAYLRQHIEHPWLILLDLGMPVMTGWEFREEQLRDPTLADMPVIVMSATIHLGQAAATLGVPDCLDKPIDLDTLLQMVKRYDPTLMQ